MVWRADAHERRDAEELACIQRIQTTATLALLTPEEAIDEQGRLDAIRALADRLERC